MMKTTTTKTTTTTITTSGAIKGQRQPEHQTEKRRDLDSSTTTTTEAQSESYGFESAQAAAAFVTERLMSGSASQSPEVALILGSGLGNAVGARLADPQTLAYADIPGFAQPTVSGHAGELKVGLLGGRKALVFCGRVHAYEGHAPDAVCFAVRMAACLDVRTLVVTNVSGAVDTGLGAGTVVALSDHLNLTGRSPLTGPNDQRFGERFPDMTDAYDPELRAIAHEVARAQGLGLLPEAVYAGVAGPQYETPAEVRMLRAMGAGLVGMSTVLEVIAARHSGLRVLGLSLVSNPAAGVSAEKLSHADVTAQAAKGAGQLGQLLTGICERLPVS